MWMAIQLAKEGFYGGDPTQVLKAPVDMVMHIYSFKDFENQYNLAYADLNKEEGV